MTMNNNEWQTHKKLANINVVFSKLVSSEWQFSYTKATKRVMLGIWCMVVFFSYPGLLGVPPAEWYVLALAATLTDG